MRHKGSLYTAFFVFFIDNFGFAVVYPLFGPLLLNPEYGFLSADTPTHMRNILLSLLYIAYPFAQFFGAPFFGDIADRWGRKKALYFTIGGVMVGYFFSALTLTFNTYVGLFISRLVTGFFAGNLSISLAIIADVSPTEKLRARNFGINSTVAGLSWILAMLVGGYLSNPKYFSTALPFWITGVFTGIGLIIVAWIYREEGASGSEAKLDILKGIKDLRLAFTLKSVRGMYFIYLCWTIGWLLVIAWFSGVSVEKYHLSQATIAWILIGNGVSWMGANMLSSLYLIKHFSVNTIALIGYLFCGICLLIAMWGDVELFAAMFIVATGFSGIAWTSVLSLISLYAPKDIQGVVMGVGQSVMALGFIFGPLSGGWLANVSILAPYLFAGALMLLGFFLLIIWRVAHR